MTEGLHRDWHRLARGMVSSFTEERVVVVKKKILDAHRARVKHRRAAILLAGAALLCSLTWAAIYRPSFSEEVSTPSYSTAAPAIAAQATEAPKERTLQSRADHVAVTEPKPVGVPRAVPLSAGTRFSVEEELSTSTYHVVKGMIRFETGKNKVKKLVVHVGALTIEDIGTVFTVETLPDTQARVSVADGRVLITWASGHVELEEGNEGIFETAFDGDQVQRAPRKPLLSALSGDAEDWRTVAKNGENERALNLIDEEPSRVKDRADDLLLAADVMRLAGHSKRAVPYLERVIQRFSHDPRSMSAAFTLGKVFLDELGRPREAAGAFSMAARDISPLAEEASAREVEAWSRAKAPERAHAAAIRYLRKYPNGARADAVKTFGNVTP